LSKSQDPRLGYADLAAYFKDQPTPELSAIREAVIAIRSKKFPDWHTVGTAGSFFKNPLIAADKALELKEQYPDLPLYAVGAAHYKCSLGFMLDKICNLKGYQSGNVGLYEKQALVLVAYRGASADEIEKFATMVASRVLQKTGIAIEREVQNF
jgi:UDP-N-acetylmuramate dehydrogenase